MTEVSPNTSIIDRVKDVISDTKDNPVRNVGLAAAGGGTLFGASTGTWWVGAKLLEKSWTGTVKLTPLMGRAALAGAVIAGNMAILPTISFEKDKPSEILKGAVIGGGMAASLASGLTIAGNPQVLATPGGLKGLAAGTMIAMAIGTTIGGGVGAWSTMKD